MDSNRKKSRVKIEQRKNRLIKKKRNPSMQDMMACAYESSRLVALYKGNKQLELARASMHQSEPSSKLHSKFPISSRIGSW